MAEWALFIFDPLRSTLRYAYGPYDETNVAVSYSLTSEIFGVFTITGAPITEILVHLTPENDCRDLTWFGDAAPSDLDVNAGDIAEFYLQASDGVLRPVYAGEVTRPTNHQADDGEQAGYQADGLSRYLVQIDTGTNYEIAAGTDVAAVARTIIENSTMHAALMEHADPLTTEDTNAIPATIGVVTPGLVNPSSVDLAQNLQALQATARGGGTLTAWGVQPDRRILLKPLNTSVLTVTPSDVIEWGDPVSPEIVTGVRWMVTKGTARLPLFGSVILPAVVGAVPPYSNATEDPLTHLSLDEIATRNEYGSRIINRAPPKAPLRPLDVTPVLVQGTLEKSFVGDTQDTTATLDRMVDSSKISYSQLRAEDSVGDGDIWIDLRLPVGTELRDVVAVSVRYAAAPNSVEVINTLARINSHADGVTGGTQHILQGHSIGAQFSTGEDEPPEHDETVVWGDRLRYAAGTLSVAGDYVRLELTMTPIGGGLSTDILVNVEDARVWILDKDALDGAASDEHYKTPSPFAFRVTKPGNLALHGLITLRDSAGDTVLSGAQVSEITKRVTGNAAIETIYTVGAFVRPEDLEAAAEWKRRNAKASTDAFTSSLLRREP